MIPYKFPHFKPIETEIMKKFLAKGIIVGDYEFDYRLPYPAPAGFELKPTWEQKMITAYRQKRIDAICRTPHIDYIIEVKKRANTQALGELEVYEVLYKKVVGIYRQIKKVIVCIEEDSDIEEAAKSHNIEIYLI